MTAKNLEYQEGRVQEKTIEEGNLPENAPPVNSSIPPEYITLLTSGDDISSTASPFPCVRFSCSSLQKLYTLIFSLFQLSFVFQPKKEG